MPEMRIDSLKSRAINCGPLSKWRQKTTRLLLASNRVSFHKLEFLCVARNQSPIQDEFHAEGREIDIPGFDQRLQEGSAVLRRHVENVRFQELQDTDSH